MSRIELEHVLGFGVPAAAALTPVDDCGLTMKSIDTPMTDALASRPDVRAAELAVEAAAHGSASRKRKS